MDLTLFFYGEDIEVVQGITNAFNAGLKDCDEIGYIKEMTGQGFNAEYMGVDLGLFERSLLAEEAIIDKSAEVYEELCC